MRTRVTAAGLAVSVCALLLGLTLAHRLVPGDTFQVSRAAHAHPAAVAELRDNAVAVPVVAEGGDEPRFACGTPESASEPARAGWSGETADCRGPPLS